MNIKELKEMINLMNENGLTELEIEKDNVKVKLKKSSSGMVTQEVIRAVAPASFPANAARVEQALPSAASIPSDEFVVRSPMVGTFYTAPNPEAEPYVAEGRAVKENDVLCIIEAMKLMNEIKSEVSGTVVAILVKSGQAVEYDQPLFRIKKS